MNLTHILQTVTLDDERVVIGYFNHPGDHYVFHVDDPDNAQRFGLSPEEARWLNGLNFVLEVTATHALNQICFNIQRFIGEDDGGYAGTHFSDASRSIPLVEELAEYLLELVDHKNKEGGIRYDLNKVFEPTSFSMNEQPLRPLVRIEGDDALEVHQPFGRKKIGEPWDRPYIKVRDDLTAELSRDQIDFVDELNRVIRDTVTGALASAAANFRTYLGIENEGDLPEELRRCEGRETLSLSQRYACDNYGWLIYSERQGVRDLARASGVQRMEP